VKIGDICLYRRFLFVRDEILTEIAFFCARKCISHKAIYQRATTLNRNVAGSCVIVRKCFVTWADVRCPEYGSRPEIVCVMSSKVK
jgi:hypothetical protein